VLIDRGRIDPRNALEAFDTAVAPLPGVTPRKGAVGRITDATSIIRAVNGQRRRLTRAQRAVVDRVLKPDPQATEAAIGAAEKAAWVALTTEARQRLLAHGYPISHPVALSFPTSNLSGATIASGYEYPGWLDPSHGTPGRCEISITPLGRADVLGERRNTIAHELFHCAQDEHHATLAAANAGPQWLLEGSAEWAGDQVAKEWNGTDLADGVWGNWLSHPNLDLGARDYDAVGFWSLLQQTGVDVFALLHNVLRAGEGGDAPAYASATGAAPGAFYDTWGPGFIRLLSLGPAWELTGPGIFASKPPEATIGNGSARSFSAAARGARGVRLRLQADIVTISANVKHGLMNVPDGQFPLGSGLICTNPDGCTCPDGKPLDARRVPKGPMFIGWQAGIVSVVGSSLSTECKKEGKGGAGPGAAGIMLFQGSVGKGRQEVARFRSGSCSVSRGEFRATAKSGAYKLLVIIPHFRGFHRYTLHYQSSEPFFVVYGPHGPFSNVYFPGGTPPSAGGAINFSSGGGLMGLGFIDTFNNNSSDDVLPAGVMACAYPRR
jgi:hypothetical protein